ncbi:hypothetical protein DFH07DRAFT_807562 [Mycena maculata]|uniref:Uncharacterized protein n=1 Tax=Mycena maculata TaxID=230809 RepID=A0AAD7NNC3_9AGAR|nr:hypothetical protein DFH07DRAFT_807562 [Mycena maculata]
MRTALKWSITLLALSLPLFFGFFFGLNYPEIVRSGWPLTRCTVLASEIDSRYCCETSCSSTCASAPSGAQSCSAEISSIDNGYSPAACASNSTLCPTGPGSTCNGGYNCCSTCCSTCQSCTTSCSGSPSTCTQSCTTYPCNCYCCNSTDDWACQLSCPLCYTVDVDVTYKERGSSSTVNTTYTQDFKQDLTSAKSFFNAHIANSTSFCYYNPKNDSQVVFDVKMTAWKWAITAIFGMFPLVLALGGFAYIFLISPFIDSLRRGYGNVRRWMAERRERNSQRAATNIDSVPPPYSPKDGGAPEGDSKSS